jgi:hypothetical protein
MGFIGRLSWARTSLVSGLLLGGTRALAQPSPAPEEAPLRVLWTSEDPACDGEGVAARARSLVAPGVVPRPLRASVEVRREGPLWVVHVETQSGAQTGRRSLRAESCHELEGAIALLLAMTMESGLDTPAPQAAPPAVPELPSALPPEQPCSSEVPPADPDEAPPRDASPGLYRGLFVRVGGKAGWGQQPGLALGAAAAAGVRLGDFELGASGTYWPATEEVIEEVEGARVSIGRSSVGLRGCWNAWRAEGLVLAPCVSPAVTWYQFESTGLRRSLARSVPAALAVEASAELRYELFGGALAISLGAGLNIERPQPFTVDSIIDQDDAEDENAPRPPPLEVYNTKAVGPRLEVGLDARF